MTTAPRPETNLWRRWRTDVLIAVGALILLLLSLAFSEILAPLAVALAIAYILNPIMRWAERHRMPRGLAATIIFLLLVGVCVAVVLFAVPPLLWQLYNLGVTVVGEPAASEAPGYEDLNRNAQWDHGYLPALLEWVREVSARLQTGEGKWYDRILRAINDSARAKEGLAKTALEAVRLAAEGFWDVLWQLQGFAVGAALAAFYLFFFLMHFDRMVRAVRRRLPGKYRERIESVVRKIDAAVAAFLRGRIVVCAAVGALTAAGLAIVGVPYWYLIGVATGLAGVVPFMPIFVGLIPAVLVAWFDAGSGWAVLGTTAVFVIVQALEGWVLTPLIQGKAAGLHPVTLTVALLVGYEVFGLFGLVASVPLASAAKILAKEFVLPKVEELADEQPASAT